MRNVDLFQMSVSRVQRSMILQPGRIAIYYGAADSYVGLAFTTADEIVSYIKEHSVTGESDTEIGRR